MTLDKENIVVLSYNCSQVCVEGARDSYSFNQSDGEEPTINIMPLTDVQKINSDTQMIKAGYLTFEDDKKEEIFKELRITNWKDILTDNAIKDILSNPTMEGLQRIIDIDNAVYFDRVKVWLHYLISGGVDITTRVKGIVEHRAKEIKSGKRKSEITLTPKDTSISVDKAQALEKQNADLQAQLDEMKAMMAQMMAMQNQQSATTDTKVEESGVSKDVENKEPTAIKKSPGRPKKEK